MKVRSAVKRGLAVLTAFTLVFGMMNVPVNASETGNVQTEAQAGDIFLPDSGNVTDNDSENVAGNSESADQSEDMTGNTGTGDTNAQTPQETPEERPDAAGPDGEDPAEGTLPEDGQPEEDPSEKDQPADSSEPGAASGAPEGPADQNESDSENPEDGTNGTGADAESPEDIPDENGTENEESIVEDGLLEEQPEAEEQIMETMLESQPTLFALGDSSEPGLPQHGYILKRAEDDGYDGSAEFIVKVSDYYSDRYRDYDILVQVYEFDEEDAMWKTKGAYQRISNPAYVGNSDACLKRGASASFELAPGEACAVYPVQPETEELYNSNNYYFDYYCWIGLKSTNQYQIENLTWRDLYTNIYSASNENTRRTIKTVNLAAQESLTWETGADGLPGYGLQIQFDSEVEDFTDYAGVQIKTGPMHENDWYYNGESTFGGIGTDGSYTSAPAICYRAELYQKESDETYKKARTLADHYYLTDPNNTTGLYDSIKDQLAEQDVIDILKKGGVISIVPLDMSTLSYEQLTGADAIGEDAQYAPVFGYDYQVRYLKESANYGVSAENWRGQVCSAEGMTSPQKVTVRITGDGMTAKDGLVIDGSTLSDGVTAHLFVKLTPSQGHEDNGKQALRFLARVFEKNEDGTYTPKDINDGTHFQNWDFVQRDPSSADQVGEKYNFNWQDNRYIECEITNKDIVRIYPVAWDSEKKCDNWFPLGNKSRGDAFEEIDIPDSSEWSFSYQIGVDNTRDNLITGGTCQNGAVELQSGNLVSTENVAYGEQHTITIQMDTAQTVNPVDVEREGLTDGGLVIDFENLANLNITYEQFMKNIGIYIRATANGMNGANMGNNIADQILMKAVYFPTDGSTPEYGAYNKSYTAGRFQKFDLSDMTEEQYNILKSGGKLVLYPAIDWDTTARFYSFDYAVGMNSASAPFTITAVAEGTTEIQEEDGLYQGLETLTYKGTRKAVLTISLEASEASVSDLKIRSEGAGAGLPNHGLLFTVDGWDDTSNYSNNLQMELVLSAPREKKNGETPVDDSHVVFKLYRYEKNSSGVYECISVSDVKTVSYPEEKYMTVSVNSSNFGNSSRYPNVYALIPVRNNNWSSYSDDDIVDEFEFTYQITGMRIGQYDITGIQKNMEEIDPLDSSVEWSDEETGTGNYEDIFLSQTLSSAAGGTKLQNLKIHVAYRGEPAVQKLPDMINQGSPLSARNMDNMVVIRNNASGYTAENTNSSLTADSMPDVQVEIFTPLRGVNAAPIWGDQQLPYQAFLYNYSSGTYTKLDTSNSYYYSFDNVENSIRYYGYRGPSSTAWGVQPGKSSTFYTHLADDQAIVIVPCSNYYSFYYQVTIRNGEQYSVESYTVNGGEFEQKSENLFRSGTIANYGETFQEVVLTTSPTVKSDQTFAPLADSLPSGQRMQGLSVILFDYDFPGLTSVNYQDQTAQYKFLLDPLNHWDYGWNHIGDNKTLTYKGIVQDTLGDDGTPVFNYSVPFSIFNSTAVTEKTGGGTKEVCPARFEFVYDEASGTYSYNSHQHHAQLEDGVIRQYDKGLGLEDWGVQSAGFFPFNRWEEEGGRWGSINNSNSNVYLLNEEKLNYHFGMSMSQEFVIPEGGQINGNDMVFRISGDDDIWLFVDGELVLDMGGIHEAVEGEINFTQGTYTCNGKTSSLEEIFGDFAGCGTDTGSWQTGTKHSFSFFYLERGGTLSNMDISFNLPLLQDFSVTKQVKDASEEDTKTEFGFTVELYEDAEGTKPYGGRVFLLDKESGERTELSAENGTFRMTLKDGETKWFSVQPNGQYCNVTEDAQDGFRTPVWTVDGQELSSDSTGIQKTGSALICTNQKEEAPAEPEEPAAPTEPADPAGPEEPAGPESQADSDGSSGGGGHSRRSGDSSSVTAVSSEQPAQAARTGDTAPIAGLALCGVLAAAAIVWMLAGRNRKQKR